MLIKCLALNKLFQFLSQGCASFGLIAFFATMSSLILVRPRCKTKTIHVENKEKKNISVNLSSDRRHLASQLCSTLKTGWCAIDLRMAAVTPCSRAFDTGLQSVSSPGLNWLRTVQTLDASKGWQDPKNCTCLDCGVRISNNSRLRGLVLRFLFYAVEIRCTTVHSSRPSRCRSHWAGRFALARSALLTCFTRRLL